MNRKLECVAGLGVGSDTQEVQGQVLHPVALPPLRSVKLLDQLRERIRYLHYSHRTEDAYFHWCRELSQFGALSSQPRAGSDG